MVRLRREPTRFNVAFWGSVVGIPAWIALAGGDGNWLGWLLLPPSLFFAVRFYLAREPRA